VIPRALATGRCALGIRAFVGRVLTDDLGQARGVEAYFDGAKLQVRRFHTPTVVLCAGAIETARLLLMSRSPAHPDGLGNRFDQVGRALQGHLYAGASGLADEDIQECIGPGVTIATCEFNHGNPGIIGGGLLANEFVPLPVHYWSTFYPTTLPRRGTEGKRAFAEAYRRRLVVMGPVQETPMPNARVTLDPQVTDKFGLPVARLSGGVHPESVKAAQMLERRAHEWLSAAGARHLTTFAPRSTEVLSGGQHQAGTCRMGEDPARSVTDPRGRVHGQRHLWIADASLHPTNGGYNPGLTVMANAYRIAATIVASK
jgi:choline dehydrogenase-like flavoprotein